jgi:hypothetical protein
LLFPLASGFGLWNQVSSGLWQRGEKARIRAFFFQAQRFHIFFALFFFALPRSFSVALASAKKVRAPTSDFKNILEGKMSSCNDTVLVKVHDKFLLS